MRAAVYLRISSDREGLGAGVERQQEDCEELAAKRGLEVVRVFPENDASAFSERTRPLWREMLAGLSAGEFQSVVAWANDRLYRRTRDQLDLMEAVQTSGGTVLTVKDGETDPSTAEGQMRMTILASVAQFESKRKSERLRRKHEQKAAAGEWSGGGRRPTGFRVVGPKPFKLVPDAREAAKIRDAARAVIGAATLHSVVVAWNDGADPLRKDSGSRWTISDVRRVLLSEQVAGLRNGTRATWEGILTEDEHALLVARLNDPSRRPAERAFATERRWLLTGFVFCGLCDVRMAGRAQTRRTKDGMPRERRQYACNSAQGGCSRVAITAPALERFLVAAAVERLDDVPESEFLGRDLPSLLTERESEVLAEMRTLEGRREDIGHQLAEGLDPRAVRVALDDISKRLDALRSEIGRATPRPPSGRPTYLGSFDAVMRFLSGELDELPAEWREATRDVLTYLGLRTTISPARAQGIRFDAGRVTATWR